MGFFVPRFIHVSDYSGACIFIVFRTHEICTRVKLLPSLFNTYVLRCPCFTCFY